jgi:hypothetical protein
LSIGRLASLDLQNKAIPSVLIGFVDFPEHHANWHAIRYVPTSGDPLGPVLAKTIQVSGMWTTTLANRVSKSNLPMRV